MNPPHPGHMFLVSELLVDALRNHATTIYILLSSSQDGVDNPLDCENPDSDPNIIDDKKKLVKKMAESVKSQMAPANPKVTDIKVEVICFGSVPFSPLYEIMSDEPDVELRMIVGIDRFTFFGSLCSMFLLNNTSVNKVSVKLLTRTEDDEPGGVKSMSATKIRNLVRDYKKASEDDKKTIMDQLNKVYEGYVDPRDIKPLVDVLSARLEEIPLKHKKASKAPVYPPGVESIGVLTEERGSENWKEQMHEKIAKNEEKVAKKRDEKIESWLEWANSLHLPSSEEVGDEAKVGDKAEVGGKSKKTKQKRRITMKRKTMRRIRRKTKTFRNYYKK
jgi:hypothetical protein